MMSVGSELGTLFFKSPIQELQLFQSLIQAADLYELDIRLHCCRKESCSHFQLQTSLISDNSAFIWNEYIKGNRWLVCWVLLKPMAHRSNRLRQTQMFVRCVVAVGVCFRMFGQIQHVQSLFVQVWWSSDSLPGVQHRRLAKQKAHSVCSRSHAASVLHHGT